MRSRLSRDQIAALPTIVETGTDRMIEGVVRWRRIDLKRMIVHGGEKTIQ